LPYSTNPAVNNWTYESISGASIPHGVGSRWAQAAWEVYWVLVDEYGFEPDLHNFDINDANEAGNKRAKFYINEGLKNTACSPTFVDARDGIIQAATDNFGGADVCRMWEAFAAFGLGTDAVSGGSNSTSPTNGFSIPAACQCQPQPIADAGGDQTICLGDSTTVGTPAQPDNTYSWSPGGQTTAQITVSPAVDTTYTVTATTAACGSGSDSATVFVDDGTQAPGLSDDFEGDNSDWSATGLWHEVANSGCAAPENGYDSPVTAFYYGQDASCDYATGAATTGTLTSPTISGVTASSTLTFDYFRVVESFSGAFDQTEVDIVTSSGATTVFALDSSTASTAAWVSSGAISLSAFAGQQIQVVFRFNSGDGVANNFAGWFIDDVVVTGESQCAPVGCTSDLECDDGAFCNGSETCNLGTGVCEAGTPPVCGDGVSCTVDSCNESTDSCDNVTNDSLCDDGAFCNGSETCDAVNDCQPGTTVDCDDGVSCTADACNEGTDSCDNAPNDSLCDDGQFCNGSEVCDVVNDCQPGSDPCAGGACDEAADICVGCLVDADCSDGQFCNGVEVCNAGVCEAGPAVSCDDGVSCTVDSCNEGTDSCDNTADDSLCSDGLFCNGVETCDAVNDCQAGVDPCAGDETCNETADICEGTGANPTLWMSFRSPTAVPGVGTVDDEDVVSYDEITGVWSLEFDGSDVGLGGFEIDGLALLAGGDLLLSFRQAGTVGGLSVDDSDIVRFTPTSLGSNTAGSFSIYFDGSDVALTSNGEDVDGIALAADGRLIVSTQGGFSGTGASGADEDLFIFTGTLGTNTSGSFAQLFDGSDVGLGGVGAEDIDAAALTAAGNLLFSTIGNFDVGTLTGPDEDVVEFSGTFGSSTSGTFSTRQDLTGLGIAAGEDIGGLWIEE
ncbi:MAG: M36 family metallopeptidase, partial [Acidobacteriota bacterium]